MTTLFFRDFDEFTAAIDGVAGRFVPTARSETDWWLRPASFGRLSVQLLQIGGAVTFAGDGTDNAITLGIPISDWASMRIDGEPLQVNSFLLTTAGQPFTFAAGRPTRWAALAIPFDHGLLAPEMVEFMNPHGKRSAQLRTQAIHINRARSLLAQLCAGDDGVRFADAAAARVAEEELMAILLHAIESSSRLQDRPMGRPRYPRGRVLARALELIEASSGQPLLLQDLCRVTCVSERTLRNVFHEYFNVGPMRLMKVRQLQEIHTALQAADRSAETVADIATRFGVWDFSSFARNYRALYGETPSRTLRSSAKPDVTRLDSKSWIRYAAQKFSDQTPACAIDVQHEVPAETLNARSA